MNSKQKSRRIFNTRIDRRPEFVYSDQSVDEFFEQWVRSEHPDYDEPEISAMLAEFATAEQWIRDEVRSLMALDDALLDLDVTMLDLNQSLVDLADFLGQGEPAPANGHCQHAVSTDRKQHLLGSWRVCPSFWFS